MIDDAINNEMTEGLNLPPFLTNNPYIGDMSVMANQYISDPPRFCQVEGCDIIHRSKGYCEKHYAQFYAYGKILDRTNFDPNEFAIEGGKCFIQLYNIKNEKTKVAVVDTDSFDLVKNHKWHLNHNGYPMSRINGKLVFLSRFLMEPIPEGYEIDHKDRDPLNNRMSNLRYATSSQNKANTSSSANASGFKGVYLHKPSGRWYSEIMCKGIRYRVTYDSKEEAALAYNKKAVELFGEFACVNKVN